MKFWMFFDMDVPVRVAGISIQIILFQMGLQFLELIIG